MTGANLVKLERDNSRIATLIDSSILASIAANLENCNYNDVTWFPNSLIFFSFVFHNVFNILRLFTTDLPAYLKCNLSHADLVVVQLWVARRGLSLKPDTIMSSARSSILTSTDSSSDVLANSRRCKAALTLNHHIWKPLSWFPLVLGNLASNSFSWKLDIGSA